MESRIKTGIRKPDKTICLAFLVLVSLVILFRIAYVNLVEYPTSAACTYALNETAAYRSFELTVTGSTVYSADELQELFDMADSAYLDEREIVLSVHVRDTGDEAKRLDVSSFAMEYGYLSGGGINPDLFYSFNPDLSDLTFEPGEEQDIFLPYPLLAENPHLVLSLYPQKIIMNVE